MTQHQISFRTVFVSDVHLGSAGCQAARLLEFLARIRAETLYLVGDIVDMESLARRFYWPQAHNDVLRELLRHARRGTRLIYVPGNHDIAARGYAGLNFGHIEIRREAVHQSAQGQRLLVMHGDALDRHLDRNTWLCRLGAFAYRHLLHLNGHVNRWRERAGLGYWPLASALKHRSRSALAYMIRFRQAAIAHARSRGFDGCVLGHIHRPEVAGHHGTIYMNCGDWVEHCTALVERDDGRFELLDWSQASVAILAPSAAHRLPRAA